MGLTAVSWLSLEQGYAVFPGCKHAACSRLPCSGLASSKAFGVTSNFTALLLDFSAFYLSITLNTKVNSSATSLMVGFDDFKGLFQF